MSKRLEAKVDQLILMVGILDKRVGKMENYWSVALGLGVLVVSPLISIIIKAIFP